MAVAARIWVPGSVSAVVEGCACLCRHPPPQPSPAMGEGALAAMRWSSHLGAGSVSAVVEG